MNVNVKSAVEDIKNYIDEVKQKLHDFRQRPRIEKIIKYLKGFFKHYIIELIDRMGEHHVFLFAGGLAFSLFVCIVPLVFIMFWVLGNILGGADVVQQVNTFVDTFIPYENYASVVKTMLDKRVHELVEFKNLAGYLGFFGLLFAASGFFSSMRTILNRVFGVVKDVNVVVSKLLDFALILLVIFLFLASNFIFPLIDVLRNFSSEVPYLSFLQDGIFHRVVTVSLSLLTIFILFSTFYKVVPVRKIRNRSAAVGAIWASLLWVGAKEIFGYYVYNIGTLGKIYGAYAIGIVIAFWIYYSSIVFIVGGLIGKLYEERKFPQADWRKADHFYK